MTQTYTFADFMRERIESQVAVMSDYENDPSLHQEIDKVITDVAHICRVSKKLLMSRNRHMEVAEARFLLYAILRNGGITLTGVGRLLDRDHGAVHHGIKTINKRLSCENEKELKRKRNELEEMGYEV